MGTIFVLRDTASDVDPTTDLEKALIQAYGASAVVATWNTVAGPVSPPVAATQLTASPGGTRLRWLSAPLMRNGFPGQPWTLSGTIHIRLFAGESNMSANVTLWVKFYRASPSGVELSVVDSAVRAGVAELIVGANGLCDWTRTPTPTVFDAGDRIGVEIHFDDAGTMAAGHTATVAYNGPFGLNDSYVEFTEDLTPDEPVSPPPDLRRSAHVILQDDN